MKICCQSLSKSSPNIWWLFGYFEKNHLLSKNYYGYFLGNIWKIWATFYFNIWSHCRLDDLASLPYFSSFFRQKQTEPFESNIIQKSLSRSRVQKKLFSTFDVVDRDVIRATVENDPGMNSIKLFGPTKLTPTAAPATLNLSSVI